MTTKAIVCRAVLLASLFFTGNLPCQAAESKAVSPPKKQAPGAKKSAGTPQAKQKPPARAAGAKTGVRAASKKPAVTKLSSPQARVSPATVTSDGRPIWLDLKSARLASKMKKRPIFVDFYTSWCGWCKFMDQTTFRDPQVQDYLSRNVVCAKLDAQDSADGEELAQRYQINAFPTYMVFDPQGKALGKFSGYREPDQLLASLKKALAFHPAGSAAKHP